MRKAYSPPTSSASRKTGASEKASRWRSTVSRAISSSPTPSTWLLVPVKYLATKSRPQPHRVEDLRAAIGLIGGDAHLGHHLEDALVGRLDVALDRLLGRQLLVDLGQHGLDRLEGEIGIDRLGAIAGKRGELMHLVRLARLHDEAHRGPEPAADQMMMHRARGEQRWHRDPVRTRRAVRQDDDVLARAHGAFGARHSRSKASPMPATP